MKQVKINKLSKNSIIPTRGSIKAAGYDLYAIENYILKPNERKLFKIGLSMEIPSGLYGRIAPRSGLALKNGIDVLAGVIDEDYRGEIGVILINLGSEDKAITVNDKIAQIIFENYTEVDFSESNNIQETLRGSGGYGSTDKNQIQKGFILGSRTSVEKALSSLSTDKREIAATYLQRFDGEVYFFQENGNSGICVVDGSGTVLGKVYS